MARRSISCNVAIYPSQGILQKALKISRLLRKRGGVFVLDNRRFYPHVTLYMTEFPVKNLGRITQALYRIAANTPPFHIRCMRYKQHEGYIDVRFQKSRGILHLHRKVVRALNPLREGFIRRKDSVRSRQLSEQKQRNLRQYGYDSVHAAFSPHLTFSKIRKGPAIVLRSLPGHDFSFRAERITLFGSGAYGTCRKLISQFKLSG